MIEDNEGERRLIQQAISAGQDHAVVVTCAQNLAHGLRQLAEGGVEVVLLDLSLPDSQGLETFHRVSAHRPPTPIIVLTELDDEGVVVEALRNGAQDYLVKDRVDGGTVTRAIRYATERWRLQQELLKGQTLRQIGQFTTGIAHDFSNYFTVINGFAEMILAQQRDGELGRRAQEILHAAQSGSQLVHHITALARQQPLDARILDLNEAVRHSQHLIQQLVGARIQVTFEQAGEPLLAKCDPAALEQILMNLATNARDAMSREGRLTIQVQPVLAEEAFLAARAWAKSGEYVHLSVSDTGKGMEPGVMERIFEPFFTSKQLGQGTGLGMAVVHALVRQLGGQIEIETAVGCGTTFHIYLPRWMRYAEDVKA